VHEGRIFDYGVLTRPHLHRDQLPMAPEIASTSPTSRPPRVRRLTPHQEGSVTLGRTRNYTSRADHCARHLAFLGAPAAHETHARSVMLGTLLSHLHRGAGLLVQTSLGPVQGKLSDDGSARLWLGVPYAGRRRRTALEGAAPACAMDRAFDATASAPVRADRIALRAAAGGPGLGLRNVEAFASRRQRGLPHLNVWRRATTTRTAGHRVHHGAPESPATPVTRCTSDAFAARDASCHAHIGSASSPRSCIRRCQSDDALSNSGNFGALDIIAALHFVHDNAQAFGGRIRPKSRDRASRRRRSRVDDGVAANACALSCTSAAQR